MSFLRFQRHDIPGYAALATLCLLAFALVRGRFRIGYVLLHVAIALLERWRDQRSLTRVARVLDAMPPAPVRAEAGMVRDRTAP